MGAVRFAETGPSGPRPARRLVHPGKQPRPLDPHLHAFQALGAEVEGVVVVPRHLPGRLPEGGQLGAGGLRQGGGQQRSLQLPRLVQLHRLAAPSEGGDGEGELVGDGSSGFYLIDAATVATIGPDGKAMVAINAGKSSLKTFGKKVQSHCSETRSRVVCEPTVQVEQEGAAAATRSSSAARYCVITPPPEIPVTPMRR